MLDSILERIIQIISAFPFSAATWTVLAILGFFVWLFAKANKNPMNPIQWEHLVIDSSNDRASPYKTGYLVGLIVATWIVVSIADKDKLTLDIFGAYLTYLLGGAGVNIFAKKDINTQHETPPAPEEEDEPRR